ncbi:MAG: phosphate acetyltransferase [Calditrichia bacterium]|nr:phosphate acetyltransferase [Calditrichia bacterium]
MDVIQNIKNQAKKEIKIIVLPEGVEERIIRAADQLKNENIAEPIILGDPKLIHEKARKIQASLDGIQIIHPPLHEQFESFVDYYYDLRKHKGISREIAAKIMRNPLFFGAMMLRHDMASGAVAGSVNTTGDVLRAAIQIVGLRPNIEVVSSCFIMVLPNNKILTFADCAVIPDPSAGELASIAISSANTHKNLVGTEPKVAMLSFSTKGSAKHPLAEKVIEATEQVRNTNPGLLVDGELQFDAAYIPEVGKKKAPQSAVAGEANVYIFPDLNSANIGYKMVQRLAGAMAIGPIIQGLAKPYNDLSRGCSVEDVVNVTAICSILSADS